MDKYAQLASLFSPSASTGDTRLDELFGLRPITDEERAGWKRAKEEELANLLGEEQRVEPSLGRQTTTANKNLPHEARALLDTIAGREAPDYNTLYGGKKIEDLSWHPGIDVPIATGPNAGKTSSAFGRYQFLKPTWEKQAAKLGLRDMSPESQDVAAWDLAHSTYADKTGRDLLGDLRSNDPKVHRLITSSLSPVWTSLPGGAEQGQNHFTYVNAYQRALAQETGQEPLQAGAGSPAEQLLPGAEQAQPDMSKFDLVTLTDGSQAYFRKDMPEEERLKRLQADNISALPTRSFTTPSGENVLVRFNMSDDEALAKIKEQTPELMARPGGLPEEDKSGFLSAAKKGVLEAYGSAATGLGGEAQEVGKYLGPESTIGGYATQAGQALRESGAKSTKEAEEAFKMPEDAGAFAKHFGYPLAEGVGQLGVYGAPYLLGGIPGAVAGLGTMYGGAMGEAEQKAHEVGKEFVPEEARPWAAGDVAINYLGQRVFGPLKKILGPEAEQAPRAFIQGLIEKEGIEGAKAKMGSLVGDVLKEAGISGGANVASGVAENMLFRGYGDQDLFSEDALKSYIDTAKQVAPVGVAAGVVHGGVKRHIKAEEITRAEETKATQEALLRQQGEKLQGRMEEAKVKPEDLLAHQKTALEELGAKAPEDLTMEEANRLATLRTDDASAILDDYLAQKEISKELEKPEVPEELKGLPIEEQRLLMAAREEKPVTFDALKLKGQGSSTAQKGLSSLDIENPEHHDTILQALSAIEEDKKMKHNPEAMQAIRTKLQEVQDAQQIRKTGETDGRGSAQSEIREEGQGAAISGEGIQQGGQRIEAPKVQEAQVRHEGIPTEEEHQAALKSALESDLTASTKKGSFASDLAAKVRNAVVNGILTPFQKEVFDERAPIASALQQLPANVGGKLRGDLEWSAHNQRGNVLQQAHKMGYYRLGKDGTLEAVSNPRLAPEQIFNRITNEHAKANGHTPEQANKIIAEMLTRLRAGTIHEQDAKTRAEAANFIDRANELESYAGALQGAEKAKYVKAAANLRKLAQGKYDSIHAKIDEEGNLVDAGGRTTITPEQAKEGHVLYKQYKDTYSKEIDNIRELLKAPVNAMRDAGMIDARTAAQFNKYPFYFPFYDKAKYDESLIDPLKEEHFSAYLNGMGGRGQKTVPGVKKQKEHAHEIFAADNLIRHLMYWGSAISEHAARKNTAEQLHLVGAADRLKGEPTDKNFVLKVMEDGKDVYYKIHDPNVYYAFKASAPIVNPVVQTLKKVAGVQRGLAVVNPLFWYRQLIREPKQASRLAKVGIITPLDAVKEIAKIAAGTSEGYKRVAEKGIVGPVDVSADPATRVRQLTQGRSLPKKTWDGLYHIHEATEAATRAIIYDRALAKYKKWGLDHDTADALAVKDARELMNFSRQGRNETLKALRAVTPFLGSWFNSIDVILKGMSPEKYGKLSKADAMEARRQFLGTSAAMITASLAYSLAMSDDEEWANNKDRNGNILVRNPFPNKDVQPWISLPLEFEIGWMQHVLPENMLLANMGSISKTAAKENVKEAAKNMMLPPTGFFSVFRPAVAAMMNFEDSKRNLGADTGGFGRGLDIFRDQKASELSKLLADKLTEAGIETSADDLEQKARQALGGAWAVASFASNEMFDRRVGEPAAPAKKLEERLPFLPGAFSGQHKETYTRDAYKVLNDIQQVQNTASKFKNTRDLYHYTQLEANPEFQKARAADKALNGLSDKMSAVSTKIGTVLADGQMGPEEKRKLKDDLEQQREDIAKEILKRAKLLGVYE